MPSIHSLLGLGLGVAVAVAGLRLGMAPPGRGETLSRVDRMTSGREHKIDSCDAAKAYILLAETNKEGSLEAQGFRFALSRMHSFSTEARKR